jgi:hypothetical protein
MFEKKTAVFYHIDQLFCHTHVEFTKHTTYNVRLNLIQHIDNINKQQQQQQHPQFNYTTS